MEALVHGWLPVAGLITETGCWPVVGAWKMIAVRVHAEVRVAPCALAMGVKCTMVHLTPTNECLPT